MFKYYLKKQINSLYLNHLFRGIAFSLFGIFVPIYFLTLGYSLQSVFIYFLLFQTILFISLILANLLAQRIGYKTVIVASVPLTIIFVLLLQLLETTPISIFLIAIIAGLKSGLYYIPMHAFFSRLS